MKNTSILFVFAFILSSCYSYVAFDPEKADLIDSKKGNKNTAIVGNKLNDVRRSKVQVLDEKEKPDLNKKNKSKNSTSEVKPVEIKITDIIKENQFYKIDVNNKYYKIEAKQWKADTLYAIKKGKPTHDLKFHKNEIKDVKIRKFSKGKSDALTVAAYALGGLGIFLLLK